MDRFVFQSSITSYQLRLTANAITRVTGLAGGTVFTVFTPGIHFSFSNNRIIWLHDIEKPLDGGQLQVEYSYRERPAGLTDFNEGSVTGTLMRALARELKLLYEQMDEAYRRAFIDHAQGVALDNVVALLGLERNPPLPAKGQVTFFRQKAADQPFMIPVGTRVTDESGRTFETAEAGSIVPDPLEEAAVHDAGAVAVANRIASLLGIWPASGDPETDPSLATLDTAVDAPFGDDERTITLAAAPPVPILLVRYVAKSVSVPIVAQQAGPEGNVNAETIVIMPTPPTGIQGVVNQSATSGGIAAEEDEPLKQRAKFHLERLGNATLNALKFAVLEIDGVEAVEVSDHSIDPAIPLGEVQVTYLGEAPQAEVESVVNETRSAGILAQLAQIEETLVSGTWHVIPEATLPPSAAADFAQAILDAINALDIGEPLSLRRLSALVYNIAGLADVAQAELRDASDALLPDPFLIDRTEVIRPNEAGISVVLLRALNVDGAPTLNGTIHQISLQLLTESGAAALDSFKLDVRITVRASLQTAPDQPAALLGTITGQATFAGGTAAALEIDEGQIIGIGYKSGSHAPEVPLEIAATAFPGLRPAQTTLTMSA